MKILLSGYYCFFFFKAFSSFNKWFTLTQQNKLLQQQKKNFNMQPFQSQLNFLVEINSYQLKII